MESNMNCDKKKLKLLTNDKIIKTLEKKSYIKIEPLCNKCVGDIIGLVILKFPYAIFETELEEDNLFILKIMV